MIRVKKKTTGFRCLVLYLYFLSDNIIKCQLSSKVKGANITSSVMSSSGLVVTGSTTISLVNTQSETLTISTKMTLLSSTINNNIISSLSLPSTKSIINSSDNILSSSAVISSNLVKQSSSFLDISSSISSNNNNSMSKTEKLNITNSIPITISPSLPTIKSISEISKTPTMTRLSNTSFTSTYTHNVSRDISKGSTSIYSKSSSILVSSVNISQQKTVSSESISKVAPVLSTQRLTASSSFLFTQKQSESLPVTSISPSHSTVQLPLYTVVIYSTMVPCWVNAFVPFENTTKLSVTPSPSIKQSNIVIINTTIKSDVNRTSSPIVVNSANLLTSKMSLSTSSAMNSSSENKIETTTIRPSGSGIVQQSKISPINSTVLKTLIVTNSTITSIKNNENLFSTKIAKSTSVSSSSTTTTIFQSVTTPNNSSSLINVSKAITASQVLKTSQTSNSTQLAQIVNSTIHLQSIPITVFVNSSVANSNSAQATVSFLTILTSSVVNNRRRRAVGNSNLSSSSNMSTDILNSLSLSSPTLFSSLISSSFSLSVSSLPWISNFASQVIHNTSSGIIAETKAINSVETTSRLVKINGSSIVTPSVLVNDSSTIITFKTKLPSSRNSSIFSVSPSSELPTLNKTSSVDVTKISSSTTSLTSTITPTYSTSLIQGLQSSSIISILVQPSSANFRSTPSISSGYYTSALSSCLRMYSTIVLIIPSIQSSLMNSMQSIVSTAGILTKFSSQTLKHSLLTSHFENSTGWNSAQQTSYLTQNASSPNTAKLTLSVASGTIASSSSVTQSSSTFVGPTSSISAIPTPTSMTNAPSPDNLLLLALKNVSSSVNVESSTFILDIEQKLAAIYVAAKNLGSKRKRRAATSETSEVKVFQTQRNGVNVDVQFQVLENNVTISPAQAKATYDKLSVPYLQARLEYQVSRPIDLVSTSYTANDVVAIILSDSSPSNISVQANQDTFKTRLAKFYKTGKGITQNVVVELITSNIRHEIGSLGYVQFYVLVGGVIQNATHVVDFFHGKTLDQLSNGVSPHQVLELPYPANKVVNTNRENLVRMKIKPLLNTVTSSESYKTTLAEKISDVYLTGKQSKSSRKRRAIGSVETKIIILIGNDPLEVVFAIIDLGAAVGSSQAAIVMNNVGQTAMQDLLGVLQVVSLPEPVLVTASSSSDDLKYWIIGVVAGSVLIMALIGVLICWRWMKGGPAKKTDEVAVDQVDMVPQEMKEFPSVAPNSKALREESGVGEDTLVVNDPKDGISVPLFSSKKHPNDYISDDLRRSQRKKVQKGSMRARTHTRQNPVYDSSIIEEASEEEEEEDEDEEEESEEGDLEEESMQRERQSTPIRRPLRKRLDYDAQELTHQQRSPGTRSPKSLSKSPKSPSRREDEIYGRRPLEMTGNLLRPDTQNTSFTADQIPTFNNVNGRKEYNINPPIRFRTNMENTQDYTKPSGPLPLLDMKQTSLISSAPIFSKPVDPDIEHKIEIERMRNKQRQREQAFTTTTREPLNTAQVSSQNGGRFSRSWRREQEKINSILDPLATDLSQRKGRLRRKLRRKNKIFIAPDTSGYSSDNRKSKPDGVVLKSYKGSSRNSTEEKMFDEEEETGDESEVSMHEARRRIHNLLDDTFQTLKKYKKQLDGSDKTPEKLTPPKSEGYVPLSTTGSLSQRYPGAIQVLPSTQYQRPATPGGTAPGRMQNPYSIPQYPQYPGYAVNPLITWDSMERQRYMNQQMGYPYGPVVNTLSHPYENPNNVYITPVHQRPDRTGGMVWSPYPVGNMPHGNEFTTQTASIPGDIRNKDMDYIKATPPRNTTIDMSDIGSIKKNGDSGSQPLIRAIKEELLKLSQGAQGKTRIQEIRPTI